MFEDPQTLVIKRKFDLRVPSFTPVCLRIFSLYCCVVESAARYMELKFCLCVLSLRVYMFWSSWLLLLSLRIKPVVS